MRNITRKLPITPWTINQQSPQAKGLVAWFPFLSGQPAEYFSGEPVPRTGDAAIMPAGIAGRGLRAPDSGSSTGALITTPPAKWLIDKPATLVWVGTIWSNGHTSAFPTIFGIKHNTSNSSPFNSLVLARSSNADEIVMGWNDSGSSEFFAQNCGLSNFYRQVMVIVSVFDTACTVYINGAFVASSGGIAGSVQYGGSACVEFNRHVTTTANSCDTSTFDARIYNRAWSVEEIEQAANDGWTDLYQSYPINGFTPVASAVAGRSQAIIIG